MCGVQCVMCIMKCTGAGTGLGAGAGAGAGVSAGAVCSVFFPSPFRLLTYLTYCIQPSKYIRLYIFESLKWERVCF